jgi:hypothetical protein
VWHEPELLQDRARVAVPRDTKALDALAQRVGDCGRGLLRREVRRDELAVVLRLDRSVDAGLQLGEQVGPADRETREDERVDSGQQGVDAVDERLELGDNIDLLGGEALSRGGDVGGSDGETPGEGPCGALQSRGFVCLLPMPIFKTGPIRTAAPVDFHFFRTTRLLEVTKRRV